MAITMTCPRCTHKNTFDDSKAREQVHCRVCHHPFVLTGGAGDASAATGKDTVKAGPPRTAPRRDSDERLGNERLGNERLGNERLGDERLGDERIRDKRDPDRSRMSDTSRRARRGRDDDDDDDDDDDRDRRSRRRRRSDGSLSVLFWVLGGLGTLLVLGCCGVVSIGVLLPMLGLAIWEENRPIPIDDPPPVVFNQLPPPVFNPPPPRLDPRNPAEVKEVLTRLKNGGPDLNDVFRWLNEADLNHPSRKEIAMQLDAMVEAQKAKGFGDAGFFDAYFRWATADNFNTLVRIVQDPNPGAVLMHRHKAMETLARLKDARAAEIIAARLPHLADRHSALQALQTMGPLGQAALVKYMNDADFGLRIGVRDALKRQGVGTDMMLTQSLTDLKNADDKVRDAALEWMGRIPVDNKRRPEVSRALDGIITAKALEGPLLKALEVWGTMDNGLTVANQLDAAQGFHAAHQIKLLGKLKDPRTLPALASRLGKLGLESIEAKNALKEFGKAAEPEVVKVLMSPDQRTRWEACQLLGDIGTAKVSIPAMQQAVFAFQQDRLMNVHATAAAKKILARGG